MPDATADAVNWHDRIAEQFDAGYQRSAAFRERARLWDEAIAAAVRQGMDVLDAGCGAGIFSAVAAQRGARVDAIDGSPQMVRLATERAAAAGLHSIKVSVGMLDSLSGYASGSYDVIICSSVLEYVEDYRAELRNFARLLRPTGRLLVSMPNRSSRYRRAETVVNAITGRPRYRRHVRHQVTVGQFRTDLAAAGLTAVTIDPFAEPPLPKWVKMLMGSDVHRKTMLLATADKLP